jgi:hypothetical protein
MYIQKYYKYKYKYLQLKRMDGGIIIEDSDFESAGDIISLTAASDETIRNLDPGVASVYNLSGLKLILKKGYPVNKQTSKGLTLLHYYARKRAGSASLNAVKLLLNNGADPSIQTNKGITALDIAKIYNKPVAKLLENV